MSDQAENKRVVRRFIKAWEQEDAEAAVECFADDYTKTVTRPSGETEEISREEWIEMWDDSVRTIADGTYEIKQMVAEDEWVLGRVLVQGTHGGTFMGIPPTGNEIEFEDFFATRLEEGNIVEHHANPETVRILEQLGVTVPPEE